MIEVTKDVSAGVLLNIAQYAIVGLITIVAWFASNSLQTIDQKLEDLQDAQLELRLRQVQVEQTAYMNRQLAESSLTGLRNLRSEKRPENKAQ